MNDDNTKDTAAPSGAVVRSPRQQRWLDAATRAGRKGNDFARAIFLAIAQPNDHERNPRK